MRFSMEQQFTAPLTAVEGAFTDPALLAELATRPELGQPELLQHIADGDRVLQQVRYAFVGELSPAVTAVVDPRRLTWVEHTELDRRTHRSVYRIQPDHYPDRLSCSGTVMLEPAPSGGTRRVVRGDLRVHFPLIGGKVERAIVSGLHAHASAEGQVVQAWLDRR